MLMATMLATARRGWASWMYLFFGPRRQSFPKKNCCRTLCPFIDINFLCPFISNRSLFWPIVRMPIAESCTDTEESQICLNMWNISQITAAWANCKHNPKLKVHTNLVFVIHGFLQICLFQAKTHWILFCSICVFEHIVDIVINFGIENSPHWKETPNEFFPQENVWCSENVELWVRCSAVEADWANSYKEPSSIIRSDESQAIAFPCWRLVLLGLSLWLLKVQILEAARLFLPLLRSFFEWSKFTPHCNQNPTDSDSSHSVIFFICVNF